MNWTIVFLLNKEKGEVCLALKKRGHGAGRWNGTGGKPLDNENVEECAVRESKEEIEVDIENLEKVAEIEFKDLSTNNVHTATAFIADMWTGEPTETEEMKPQWFKIRDVPYSQMWEADKIWIPLILSGRKIKAVFEYEKGDTLKNHFISPLTV